VPLRSVTTVTLAIMARSSKMVSSVTLASAPFRQLPGGERRRGQRVTVRQPQEPRGRRRRLKAMMDIAVRAAARPGQRRLVLLWAVMAGIAAGPVIGLAAPMARRIPVRRRICECQLASVTAARRPYGRSPDPPRQPEADPGDTLTVCPRVAARFAA
jgi:hypothetical protein